MPFLDPADQQFDKMRPFFATLLKRIAWQSRARGKSVWWRRHGPGELDVVVVFASIVIWFLTSKPQSLFVVPSSYRCKESNRLNGDSPFTHPIRVTNTYNSHFVAISFSLSSLSTLFDSVFRLLDFFEYFVFTFLPYRSCSWSRSRNLANIYDTENTGLSNFLCQPTIWNIDHYFMIGKYLF